MFVTKYIITNRILKNIGVIEAAKEIVETVPIIPAWEMRLKKEALERAIYFGVHLEGNSLSLEEIKDILDGKEVRADDTEIQEVRNYQHALKFIDHISTQIGLGGAYILTLETIIEFHHLLSNKLVPEQSAGSFRVRQIALKDSKSGEISFLPPPANELPYLMEDLLNWINSPHSKEIHPVIRAAIIHFELSRIHPFTFSNGKVARLVSLLVLFLDGYNLKKFISTDEYFDNDPLTYHSVLQTVFNQKVVDTHERDLTPWIEYYSHCLSLVCDKTKERVKRVGSESHLKDKLGDEVTLNERQMLIMEYLHRHKSMKNADFRKIFPDYSDDTVLRELRFLNKKGLIKKEGTTKKAVYVLK